MTAHAFVDEALNTRGTFPSLGRANAFRFVPPREAPDAFEQALYRAVSPNGAG